ncbi:MAG: hypothetical protein K6E33_07050 [Lachnospiraceae bacterium]|nr:hypothetical protein [Lachnospiraceae bacterium]
MMRKKLLILGATSETVKMVERAESMGAETYVADPFEDAHAKKVCSHPVLMDCFDTDAVCQLAVSEGIDGVLPGCADILMAPYEEVCERLSLPCYVNKDIVRVFNNKAGLKRALEGVSLPTVPEYSREEAESDSFSGYPLFVKPVDNNSSKGMYIADDRESLETAIEKARSFSRSDTVLIEEVMDCDDFYVGYFLQDGNAAVTFTGDRYVNKEQKGLGSITSGIVYPSVHTDLYFDAVHEKMLRLFDSIGFRNGILNIQGFVRDNKIMFYDPALRITGGQEYMLSKHFYGLDILGALVNLALSGSMGDSPLYTLCDHSFSGRCGCNLTFSVRPGTIGRIEGMDYAACDPHVLNITQEHGPGTVIDRPGTAQQNFARMHLFADSREEMKTVIKDLQEHVIAYDDKGNDMMLKGLDPESI